MKVHVSNYDLWPELTSDVRLFLLFMHQPSHHMLHPPTQERVLVCLQEVSYSCWHITKISVVKW